MNKKFLFNWLIFKFHSNYKNKFIVYVFILFL